VMQSSIIAQVYSAKVANWTWKSA